MCANEKIFVCNEKKINNMLKIKLNSFPIFDNAKTKLNVIFELFSTMKLIINKHNQTILNIMKLNRITTTSTLHNYNHNELRYHYELLP